MTDQLQNTASWTKVTVTGAHEDLDDITAVMSMLDNGLMIEDYSDLELNGMYGELMDDSLLTADRDIVRVSLFVPAEKPLPEYISFLRERFQALNIEGQIDCEGVNEEDWAESWKQYYKPVHLGRVTVVPAWETYEAAPDEIIIRMDPGMAFGTGTHETTQLVIRLLEGQVKGGERVLDVGCGSGILSLCAAKLGAASCAAYDIDPVAVRVAKENIEADGAANIVCGVSDLLHNVDTAYGPFDLVVANIVADIILRMAPDLSRVVTKDARIILSGIIEDRVPEVTAAMEACGYRLIDSLSLRDWYALLMQRQA